jgi:hypothetical protein
VFYALSHVRAFLTKEIHRYVCGISFVAYLFFKTKEVVLESWEYANYALDQLSFNIMMLAVEELVKCVLKKDLPFSN